MRLGALQEINAARRERRAVVVVTDVASGETRVVKSEDAGRDPLAAELARRLASGRSGMLEDGRTFLTVQSPPPRMVIIGAVHISQALAPMAKIVGFDVTIIDPRTAFATRDRFPDVSLLAEWPEEALKTSPLDAYTALVALTHDPKVDDYPLGSALKSGCFYVGALGSRKTHAKRVERLREQGATQADVERIRAPIGVDINAQSPAEIAVAVLAEVIAALRRAVQADRIAA
jgi:xanthine dehydrogenase accessory factor